MRRRIRPPTSRDLPALQGIESAADELYARVLGPEPFGDAPCPTGADRAAAPGFLLVAEVPGCDAPIGFVHVVAIAQGDQDGPRAHLEQLAVLPAHQRRGLGGALVDAARREAGRRGHREITLRTFADIPWNAPFYARHGFREAAVAETEPGGRLGTPFDLRLLEAEAELGLLRHGRRLLMVAPAL